VFHVSSVSQDEENSNGLLGRYLAGSLRWVNLSWQTHLLYQTKAGWFTVTTVASQPLCWLGCAWFVCLVFSWNDSYFRTEKICHRILFRLPFWTRPAKALPRNNRGEGDTNDEQMSWNEESLVGEKVSGFLRSTMIGLTRLAAEVNPLLVAKFRNSQLRKLCEQLPPKLVKYASTRSLPKTESREEPG
jgi:hypothetical protein